MLSMFSPRSWRFFSAPAKPDEAVQPSEPASRDDDQIHAQRLQALGQCAGGVAHDVRNLLSVVLNNLHELRQRYPAAADCRELAAIEHATLTAADLTRNLLEFAGKQRPRSARLDLETWLPPVRQLLLTTTVGVMSLHTEVDAGTPAICVDPTQLELAVINLVLNAREAAASTGVGTSVAIRVRMAAADDLPPALVGGRYVLVRVEDDGSGIPPHAMAHLFKPFFTTKREGYGTGLGLSQVQAFCEQAGGTALAGCSVKGGARFDLILPACDDELRLADADASHRKAPRLDPMPLDVSVLVVDDDTSVAQGTAAVLRSFGARVRCASHPAEAVRALGSLNHGIDLVLSDVHLPDSDAGVRFAKFVSRHWPEIPVLLMSGFVDAPTVEKLGGFKLIDKPCRPAVLVAAVRSALEKRGSGAESLDRSHQDRT